MNSGITYHPSVHEVELWKRFRSLLRMMMHLEKRERLIRNLQEEAAIPEKTRDEAITALKAEHEHNIGAFHDFLVNFVNLALQGLHRVDISVEFSWKEDGILQCRRSVLHVENHSRELLREEGQRLLAHLSWKAEGLHPEQSLIGFYETLEQKFDQESGGELGRSSLEIMEEIYPSSGFHATIRLPAQAFMGNGDRSGP